MPQRQQIQIKQELPPNAVSGAQWGLMIAVALFFDTCKLLLQLIPVAGQVLAIVVGWFAFATFWLWFTILGAKYSKTTMIGGFVSDFIPLVDVLSETVTILLLYFQSKADKVIAKVPGGQRALNNFNKATSIVGKPTGTTPSLPPIPHRQYTPGVAEMPKRNPDQSNNLSTEKKGGNKVVDIGAARERLEQLKQQNAMEQKTS